MNSDQGWILGLNLEPSLPLGVRHGLASKQDLLGVKLPDFGGFVPDGLPLVGELTDLTPEGNVTDNWVSAGEITCVHFLSRSVLNPHVERSEPCQEGSNTRGCRKSSSDSPVPCLYTNLGVRVVDGDIVVLSNEGTEVM